MSKFAPAIAAQMGAVDRKLKKSTVALGAVATGAGAAGAALFSIGSDFDDAADKIRIGTGKTGKALGRLNDDFKAVIKGVPATFDDASDAVSQLNQRLGITGKPLRRLSKQVLELSRITGTDLDTNIREVTRTFGDWGISLQDQPEALNKMFRASQKTGTAVQDLGRQLVRYGAPLRQLGFSFEEAAGLVGKFEQEGVNAQLVLGSLRIALGNLSDKGVKDAPKALALLTKEVKNAGTNLEATGIASKIFGKRAGPDMALAIREGRFNVAQLFDTIENGRDSIQKASRDTQDFNETWLKFKNNVMVALEPLAKRVFGGISKEAAALTKILTDPKLSGDEKFSAILDRIADGISKAVPKIMEAAAQAAPKIAVAFVRGFLAAPIWAQLATGAFLISKFGGLSAWKSIGRRLGLPLGTGLSETAASQTGKVLPGALGRHAGKLRTIGRVGIGAALAVGIGAAMTDPRDGIGNRIQNALSGITFGVIPGVKDIATRLNDSIKAALTGGDAAQQGFGKFIDQLDDDLPAAEKKILTRFTGLRQRLQDVFGDRAKFKLDVLADPGAALRAFDKLEVGMNRLKNRLAGDAKGIVDVTRNNLKLLPQIMDLHSKAGQRAISKNMRLATEAIVATMRKGTPSVQKGMRAIRTAFVLNSQAAKETTQKNFGIALEAIKRTMSSGGKVTDAGLREIRKLFKANLALYGIKGREAEIYLDVKPGKGKPLNYARGGPIDFGAPVGDSVPAMLERGEYVLNRKAVKEVGRKTLDRVNFKGAPRFQSGGIVALGRRLQREGYDVGEHPAFGGVDPVHVAGSYHYKDQAIDVNADNFPGGEMGALDKLYARLKRLPGVVELLWRVANHFDHLHVAMAGAGDLSGLGSSAAKVETIGRMKVGGPDTGLKAGIQAGLDRVRQTANDKLQEAASNFSADMGEPSFESGSGPVEKTFAEVAKKLSTSKVATLALGMAGYTESGMRDLSYGDASSQGALQLLASTAQGLGVSPHDEKAIASLFFTRGFYGKGGANALAAQGLPAHLVAQSVQGSATPDGSNYAAQESKARAWMKRYGLRKGGLVGYVGDSLGVGTAPKLKGRIGDLIANVAESRTSAQGLKALKGMLGSKYARYIWDLGTNDGDAGSVKSNLKAADRATGDRLLLAATVTGANAKAKNAALRDLAGGDINLFEWAKRSKGLLEGDVHPDGAGYSKRAAMMAGALSAATSRHKGKGKDEGKLPKLKGTLTQKTRQTAKALSASKDKKRRAKILKRFQKHLKKYGLPNKLLSEINFLTAAHDRFSSFAEAAESLDITNDDDSVTRGTINGKNVGGWLTEDLNAMFKTRNKLVKARDIVTRNQSKVQSTLGFVNEQLKNLSKDGKTPRGWKGVDPAKDAVEKWNKQPAPKRHKRMKAWRDKHGKLPGTREFNTFTGKIRETPKSRVPALEKVRGKLRNQNTELTGAISPGATDGPSILPQLEGLQGFGPPGILKSPWPIGTVWGGDILSTQQRMLELFKVPPKTTDDTTSSDDTRVPLLEQLLREANLRTQISERQFDVLRNFPPFGGQFATGGTVPGPAGAPRTVIAHGGETIIPEGKGGAAAPNVYVNFDGKVSFLRDFVDVRIEQQTRKATGHSRVLPGRKGG